jgi:uncharacterized phage protein (TIGR01671 family)
MREINFRGKRLDNGKWVVGDLIENQGRFFIYHATSESTIEDNDDGHIVVVAVEVEPATVGQYTGLKDKNGKKIWEGDIVAVSFGDIVIPLLVVFDCGGWKIREKYDETLHDLESYTSSKDVNSVIGNIHDNPELIETE